MQLETLFTEMADALRTKEETTDKISAESFPQRIKDLKVLDTTDATATANDIVAGKIAYANGKRVIGTIIDNGALEYTPSNEEQIIPAGKTSGGVVKKINSEELVITPSTEEQIKEGLFNKVIVGPMLDTSDATATAEDILKNKTAYVNGEKVIGVKEVGEDIVQYATSISFRDNTGLTDVKNLDVRSMSSLSLAFQNCTNLKSVSIKNTQKLTSLTRLFYGCSSLESFEIEDTSKVQLIDYLCWGCTSLETAPEMNLSNLSSINNSACQNVFNGCTNLKNVPVYNIPNPTTMYRMFYNCPNLTDESLNNILLTCISAIKVASTIKTLKDIGLSQDQATRCQSLSNYEAFVAAGWVTGY